MTAWVRRKVYNDLGQAYFVAALPIDIGSGEHADFQGMILTDENGDPYGPSNPLPMATTATPFSAVSYQATANVTAVSGVLLAANSSREGGWIRSLDTNSQDIVVTFAATATLSLPTRLAPGASLPLINAGFLYQGVVAAISVSGTQVVEILEI